jgi:hypothetical protein
MSCADNVDHNMKAIQHFNHVIAGGELTGWHSMQWISRIGEPRCTMLISYYVNFTVEHVVYS